MLVLNPTNFYINTDLIFFKNKIFLNEITFTNNIKTPTKSTTRPPKPKIYPTTIIDNNNRENILKYKTNPIIIQNNPSEIIDNITGEVISFNEINLLKPFRSKLFDNRFIATFLTQEYKESGLFLTITTAPQNNLNKEVYELESISKKIEERLTDNNTKYIKVYELTKNNVPHIHFLILNQEIKQSIEKILNNYQYKSQILNIKQEETTAVAMYITKMAVQSEKHQVLWNFEKELKNNNTKLFTSSKSKIYTKAQRKPLWNAFLLHNQYSEKISEYQSEDFMKFVWNDVKSIKTSHNLHLNDNNPYYYIEGMKIYHNTHLRVFSRYSRVNVYEKRSILKTHKKIIEYSLLLLKKLRINPLSIIYQNYINNPYFSMFHIINYILFFRISIIKPPP